MAKKVALPRLIAGAAIALAIFMTVKVEAVNLNITAAAVCNITGGIRINYTASVTGNSGIGNPSVNISFDGGVVDNGAWVSPTFAFSGSELAPAGKGGGDTVVVSLDVVGTWTNGVPPDGADNHAETTVTLPDDCRPPVFNGCTPGYWKQDQHFDSWPAPYDPTDYFNDLPGFADAYPNKTLLQVLQFQGGGLQALGRHTVAAILNTASGFGMSLADIQAGFNAAVASGDTEGFKNILAAHNELRCPLN